jgi:hypothetical protein
MGKFSHTVNEKLCQARGEPINFIIVDVLTKREDQTNLIKCVYFFIPFPSLTSDEVKFR